MTKDYEISANALNQNVSIWIKTGKLFVPGVTTVTAPFKFVSVTSAGSLVIKTVSTNGTIEEPIYFPAVALGALIPVLGVDILPSAEINGVTYNTTATGIWVYGGK